MPNKHRCRGEAIPGRTLVTRHITNPPSPTVTNGGCRIASPSVRPSAIRHITNDHRKGEPILPLLCVAVGVSAFARLAAHQREARIASPLQSPSAPNIQYSSLRPLR